MAGSLKRHDTLQRMTSCDSGYQSPGIEGSFNGGRQQPNMSITSTSSYGSPRSSAPWLKRQESADGFYGTGAYRRRSSSDASERSLCAFGIGRLPSTSSEQQALRTCACGAVGMAGATQQHIQQPTVTATTPQATIIKKIGPHSNNGNSNNESSDLASRPSALLDRSASFTHAKPSSLFRQSSSPSFQSMIRNKLTANGIGSLDINLATNISARAEEIVTRLEQEPPTPLSPAVSYTQEGNTSGPSSLPSSSQHLEKRSSLYRIPEDTLNSSSTSKRTVIVAELYPTQRILETLDEEYLTVGDDGYYYERRDYTLNDVQPLGEGGFGTCVPGQDAATQELFALKHNNRDEEEKIGSIVSECAMLGRLRAHENVVRFLGAMLDEEESKYPPKVCKMVMELAENGKLTELLVDEDGCSPLPLPVDQSLYYLQQILQGVLYLHNNDVLHLDIKCDNVLVFNNGRTVKLADFGSALRLCDIPSIGKAKLKGCSPHFAAPEVVRQDMPYFSSDIWSVACVLVQLLTAKLPGCQKFTREQRQMIFLIGKYMDDNIEEIVPLQFDYGVNDFFRIVLRRDHCDRPTALSLLLPFPLPLSCPSSLFLPSSPSSHGTGLGSPPAQQELPSLMATAAAAINAPPEQGSPHSAGEVSGRRPLHKGHLLQDVKKSYVPRVCG